MSKRVEGTIMARMVSASKQANSPYTYGAMAYLALNLLLVAAEARWHILAKLTLLDAAEIKQLISMIHQFAQLSHH